MIGKLLLATVLYCVSIFGATLANAESQKIPMSYTECLTRKEVVVSQLGVRARDIIPIVNSNIMSVTKYCTIDGSLILTCSKPDNAMIIVSSANKCR